MSVGSADLHKAIVTLWNNSNMEWELKKNWDESDRAEYPGLHDQEAVGDQPFPYVVFEGSAGNTVARMSGHVKEGLDEIRDMPFAFRVHTRAIVGVAKSAKEIAAELIEKIMIRFGGHPTVSPQEMTLDNGGVLIAQYQNDFGVRTGDDEYQWILNYIFRIDVPVAV